MDGAMVSTVVGVRTSVGSIPVGRHFFVRHLFVAGVRHLFVAGGISNRLGKV